MWPESRLRGRSPKNPHPVVLVAHPLPSDPTMDDTLANRLSKQCLHGRPVPTLLRKLWDDQLAHPDDSLLLNYVGEATLVDSTDGDFFDGYRREEIGDPDLARAFWAMFERIAFIAREADGALIGYWLGDDPSDLEDAPIIFLSNEGSFYYGGDNLAEYMIYSCDADMFVDDEETVSVEQHLRQWLSNAGCSASAAREELQAKIDGQSSRFDEVFERFQAASA